MRHSPYLPGIEQTVLDLQARPPRLPRNLRPMLARGAPAPFVSGDHLFDVSWGGRRALVFVEAPGELPAGERDVGRITVVSAGGLDVTEAWPEVAQAARGLTEAPLLLDGELIRPPARPRGRGRSSVQVPPGPVFIAFDLLAMGGRLLLAEPLHHRRRALAALLGGAAAPRTPTDERRVEAGDAHAAAPDGPRVPHAHGASRAPRASIVAAIAVEADGTGLYQAALSYGLPGIVAKRRDGPYLPGVRSGLWRTIRAQRGTGNRAEDLPAAGSLHAGTGPRAGIDPDDVSEQAADARRRALSVILRLPL